MDPLIELVTLWSRFVADGGPGDLQTFAEYIRQRRDDHPAKKTKGGDLGVLARIIGRIGSAYGFYHRAAMSDLNLPSPDSFFYLNSLNQLGEVRKTELINYLFVEITTGMETIGKLVESGLIRERTDPADGRARLIKLTAKGSKKLNSCRSNASKVNEMIFYQMASKDVEQCIGLLEDTEKSHTQRTLALKGKSFNEMYSSIVGSEA